MTSTAIKYEPKTINDVVFNNSENERRIKLIFSGYKNRHLFLSGANGSGKTTIANLIASELTNQCSFLHLTAPIEVVMSQDDIYSYFMRHHTLGGGAISKDRVVIVFNELDKYSGSLDKLWTTMDRMTEELLVIITTNYPMKFENAIRSRCAKFNFTRITADDFLCRAQWILKQENVHLPDAHVLYYLKSMTVATSDVRDYHEVLDDLIFSINNNLALPIVPSVHQLKKASLSIAK